MTPRFLVVDGHDGAGKTTLAHGLARELGAIYVKPFFGAEGAAMLDRAEAGMVEEASLLASQMVAAALDRAPTSLRVLDRHWMTVLTLLPERLWEQWLPQPPTLLCFSDLKTTLGRLARRSEQQPSESWHAHYIECYRKLAERFSIPLVRTDRLSEEEALRHAVEWAGTLGQATA